ISNELISYLNDYLLKLNNPFKQDITIRLFDANRYNLKSNVTVGESHYLICKTDNTKDYELGLGYMMEHVILDLERLDIKSVIMASTFDHANFEKAILLNKNEIMPCVVALGFEADVKNIKERALRRFLHSDSRKEIVDFVSAKDLNPLELNSDELLIFEAIRLAPSAKNIQPIRIIKDNSTYHFYLNHTKGFSNEKGDIQKVDLGIALCHAELVSKELGYNVEYKKFDNMENIDDSTDYQISIILTK
ncbi:MAG: hypothetical protein K6G28_04935, partial [Acholeplasmatales bacterium]|nr:hypothetical protein [Acholeplasmatales bacterium]